MEPTVVTWIDSFVGAASGAAVALLLLINGAFAAGVLLLRDRNFVNRWTNPLIVADAALLFAVVGTPILGIAMRLGIRAFELVVSVPSTLIAGK